VCALLAFWVALPDGRDDVGEAAAPLGTWWLPGLGHLIFAALNNGVRSMDRFHELITAARKAGVKFPGAVQIDIAGTKLCGISDLEDIVRAAPHLPIHTRHTTAMSRGYETVPVRARRFLVPSGCRGYVRR
jgi:hypothetical protein